ncbi:hypothetical protein F2Q68_00027104 [Brassica cretica]|uniref:Uncharacterized protein n=1 Tax=Brassica cretica TaxID=69181 RepID=A0A8S9IAK7_BRACR|nr:hypothetical protein F2Q68_00027104 [Brassica cretica]
MRGSYATVEFGNWDLVINWLISLLPKRAPATVAAYQVWAAVLFEVWRERNRRSHDGTTFHDVVLIRSIMRTIKDKGTALLNTGLPLAQGVPDPSSDVCDPRAAPDLFLVGDSIRQLASDDQDVPDQATKDVCDPIEATQSIPARVPFVSSSRLNSFGGPIQQSSKVKR